MRLIWILWFYKLLILSRLYKYCFLGLLLLKAFTRRVAEFGVKNYLGVYSQGVFSSKVRIEHSSKAFKRVYLCFCSF